MSYLMKQCRLVRKHDDQAIDVLVSWIPDKFAKKGKLLKLKQNDGRWEQGWVVDHVYSQCMLYDEVKERSQDYKHHRKHSDI